LSRLRSISKGAAADAQRSAICNQRILVLDEVDLLMTKKQDILYHFFEWPQAPRSMLTVIAIANTMDLPERVFCNRVSSRMGMIRLNFIPYSHIQLVEILKCKADRAAQFTPDALEFCARKVSSVSGDARRALSIAKLAAEMACCNQRKRHSLPAITIAHVDSAIKQMFATASIQTLLSTSTMQKLLLVALASTLRRSGLLETRIMDIHSIFIQFCSTLSLDLPSTDTVASCLSFLDQSRCIVLEKHSALIHSRVRLNVSEDDIKFAFKDEKQIKKFLNF
jgi:origin recognition complex subunit 1